ncbi:MAG TPA: ATP-binding protein [Gemmatimonadaceae bacterium]|jgi:serine/threonine-protein kinase RsbW|nr:ATP-binding protein [Gemmatimonadaceae bacterium]
MAKPRVALDIEIPSDVKYIEQVVELATRECRELHLPPQKCSLNVPVALSEALSNAILRGNRNGKGKVRLRAVIKDDSVVFEVTDEGQDFDMDKARVEPTAENVTREEGRGLFLMHRLMDRVEHMYKRGNTVRLTLLRE